MPSGVSTLTGNTGPGATVTALRLSDVSNINFNFRGSMIHVTYGQPDKTFDLSWTGITTVTFSISSGVPTVTIS